MVTHFFLPAAVKITAGLPYLHYVHHPHFLLTATDSSLQLNGTQMGPELP
jgi:hypothetical protein